MFSAQCAADYAHCHAQSMHAHCYVVDNVESCFIYVCSLVAINSLCIYSIKVGLSDTKIIYSITFRTNFTAKLQRDKTRGTDSEILQAACSY